MSTELEDQTNAVTRPGKPKHHLLNGAIAIAVVTVLLAIMWTVWGDRFELPCFWNQGACEVDGVIESPFTAEDAQASVLPPEPSSLPELPPIPDETLSVEGTIEME